MRSTNADTELETLASRAQQGDRDAFAALVEQTHGVVYRLALRIVSASADAEDVVQETYIRAWRALPRLRDPRAVLGWLCRIARHIAIDRTRHKKRHPVQPLDDERIAEAMYELLGVENSDPERALASAETREILHRTVATLADKYRVVFLLRESEGMSYDEIAQVLGCPVGTVESRLHRARRQLADKLLRIQRAHQREVSRS